MDKVTVKGPLDAISVIPHLLGFHPEDSIVILGISVTGEKSLAARIDHPHNAADMLELLRALRPAFGHFAERVNLVVCYTDDKEHAYATATLLREELPGRKLEPLMVHQGHMWQIDLDGFEGDGTRFVANDVGLDPLKVAPSRGDLRHDLESATVTDEFVHLLAAEATRLAGPINLREEATWLVDRLVIGAATMFTDEDLARVCAAVAITDLRDVVWSCLTNQHLELFRDAVRRCGPVAGMRTLLAFVAWLSGDGALAWMAIELTREIDPAYPMVGLVAMAVENAVHPDTWEPAPLGDLAPFKED